MNTLGIDIGSLNIKAVVLGDGGILGTSIVSPGDDIEVRTKMAIETALGQAGLNGDNLPVVTTGIGAKLISFIPQQKSLTTCLARGVHYMLPSVTTVIDTGS